MAVVETRDPIWMTSGEAKRSAVRSMFAAIAPNYDRMNDLMSFFLHRKWRAFAVGMLNLQEGATVLDLCSGTGDFLVPLRKAVGQTGELIALDFCSEMLDRAKSKDKCAQLSLGDACRLPIANESVDAVTVGWGIRNVADIDEAHREIARAIRPGGAFVSLDMAIPQNPVVRATSRVFSKWVLPALGRVFGNKSAYTYLPESAERFLSREELARSMEQAGFASVRFKNLLFGNICIHIGVKR